MVVEREGIEYVGLNVVGPPPVGDVWIPLAAGVHALYGLNGAGKSSILRAIAQLFADGSADGGVLLRPTRGTGGPDESGQEAGDVESVDHARRMLHQRGADFARALSTPLGKAVPITDPPDLPESVLFDVFRSGTFIASKGRGRWHIEAAVPLDGLSAGEYSELRLQAGVIAAALAGEVSTPFPEILNRIRKECAETCSDLGSWSRRILEHFVREGLGFEMPGWGSIGVSSYGRWSPHLFEVGTESFPQRLFGGELGGMTLITEDLPDLVELTTFAAAEAMGDSYVPVVPEGGSIDTVRDEILLGIASRASEISERVLLDAPVLLCEASTYDEMWCGVPPVRWSARDRDTGFFVPLAHLSSAQRRWAHVAIKLALVETLVEADVYADQHYLVLLDEPERALHRRAERHMVEGLKWLSERLPATVLAATHSAEMLAASDIRLHHVRRGLGGHSSTRELRPVHFDTIEELGLERSDVLQHLRSFVIVEGRHDEVVFDAMMGDELRRARAHVVPMRGARQLSTVLDSQLIFEYTNATAVVVLDNVAGQHARSVWSEAVRLDEAGERAEAEAALHSGFSGKRSVEERFLREFCVKALREGRPDRIKIATLSAGDVVEYLPADALVPRAHDWASLRAAHESHQGLDFKKWLSRDHGAMFDDEHLREAVGLLDHIPREMTEILDLCRVAAGIGEPR